ncbi:MAG: GntR family transcriptional regulator [Oceanospirillaceae bacterium]|uniref:aminotransferase-like domain-containing protein n=1 Tax=unclassified Thalassolituus TaxID=2624967 RepID=UPI000C09A9D0|nr:MULTISPECIES: PLP-dependent aminotransferase family protein [unclassified Thalassolituus]MAK92800.1 GntR family transcriptional regulator [Thalassolituus sp.]MAS24227.1 GntR family transcriptional regulator [Oceanospirillaceae bacterium]MBL36181.1 GntR family transcriptional regulator [Oceanospirillaceae bacterium]MBS53047.1 GntR family transcriptional regulator [Oceanospirillaceae bacterium]|tara:strand:- start:449 stop:1849 length:1401 start_codon:yes stop_codon:yes gene_type:complete
MKNTELVRWARRLKNSEGIPAYRLIADLIAEDIDSGRLQIRDRLPPLRDLATATGINYTTAARAYQEAKTRGLIDSRPGSGSFVKGQTATVRPDLGNYEMTMNLVIEPAIPTLVEQIRDSAIGVMAQRDIYSMLRYQPFGGTQDNREAALVWLDNRLPNPQLEQVLICPGIHSALVGLMSTLVEKHQVLCVEGLTYPGIKAIASHLGISLYSLPRDNDGPLVKPFEEICKLGNVGAIYLNPTLQNPTTATISKNRREAIADVCLRYSIPVIEDEAYTMLAEEAPVSFSELIPDLSWYITGTSKCFGPGVRSAFLHTPGKRKGQRLAAVMRVLNVMSSPLTDALVSRWILDGTADQMIKSIRREAIARLRIAEQELGKNNIRSADGAFHLWLPLPKHSDWNPSELAVHLRQQGVSAVSSAAFSTDNNPPDAVRLCFGGPIGREQWQENVHQVAEIIEHPSYLSTGMH